MSNEYCDRSPCNLLQKFIEEVAAHPQPGATVQAKVVPHGRTPKKLSLVTFYYCPFCGTCLDANEEVLKWIAWKKARSS
jgi:thiol-disulfide isomerase/thioredoxin